MSEPAIAIKAYTDWLAAAAPALLVALNGPATAAHIDAISRDTGLRTPPALAAFYERHDNQLRILAKDLPSYFAGLAAKGAAAKLQVDDSGVSGD